MVDFERRGDATLARIVMDSLAEPTPKPWRVLLGFPFLAVAWAIFQPARLFLWVGKKVGGVR